MTQAAKAQEPSMEEILASIRRIIADDDVSKPAKAPEQAPPANPTAAARCGRDVRAGHQQRRRSSDAVARKAHSATGHAANSQDEIDAMLAELDAPPKAAGKPAPMPAPSAPMPARRRNLAARRRRSRSD